MPSRTEYDEALLKAHRLHVGIYRRVADQLGVDASYVSRVATGKRKGPKIRRALLDELHKIQRLLGRNGIGEGLSGGTKLKTYKPQLPTALRVRVQRRKMVGQ